MGAKRITAEQKRLFVARLRDGWPITECAQYAGVSYPWGKAYARGMRNSSGREAVMQAQADANPVPIKPARMKAVAKEALENIEMFGAIYFGVIVMPWQAEATGIIVELMDTDEEEYVVINCPPGSGKSTFFTKIVPAWLTCKRRHIRGTIGSASMTMAKQYVGELRDILEQPVPLTQSPEAIRAGIAVEPERCLVTDFGTFKPNGKKWASDAFFVAQPDNISKKEPTWQAFGRGTVFIGTRSDFAIWDDPWDPEGCRTEDSRSAYFNWWDTYAEKRLEPGGLMVVQMQRLDPLDISNHCLSKKAIVFDAQGEVTAESIPKYRHIVFKAHYDDRCQGAVNHGRAAPPYPEGCLLFPRRLPWTKLATERENNPEGYELVYQQEETSPGSVLVDKLWIRGGIGTDGVEYPGCWDEDRGLCELPEGLSRPVISIVSADPSPSKFWGISWWAYHPDTHQHFLLDLQRKAMRASDFLDYDVSTGRYVGLMEDWQRRSENLGIPISHYIVESNAAARFLRQYSFFQTWVKKNRVMLIPHECVDPATEVLSRRGWMKSHEVVVGDDILTMNMATQRSEWQPVEYVYRGHHAGPMARFSSRTLDALTTPDHRWAVTDQAGNPFKFVESQNLNTGHVVPLARVLAPDQEPMGVYSDDLVELVGWAVTEGHFRKTARSPGNTAIDIGQSRRANPGYCERIRLLLKRLGARWNEHDNHSGYEVSVFTLSGPVAREVRDITGSAKELPPEFIGTLTATQRALLRRTLVDGDGWRQGPRTESFCSDSESLIQGFEMLCALDGIPTYRSHRADRPQHMVVRPKCMADAFMQSPGNRPVPVDYEGEVWCPNTVNGTFYARRGGKTYFTGNTHRNKSDPKFGVQMLAPLYKNGLVRLPGKQFDPGRQAAAKLVSEVTRYRLDGRPSGTTDCLMSQWFETFCLPGIIKNVAARDPAACLWTPPSWVRAS